MSRSLREPSATAATSKRGEPGNASWRHSCKPPLDVASRLDQAELLAEIARHVTALCRCHTCEIMEYLPDDRAVRVLAEYDAKGRRWSTSGVFSLDEFPVTRRVLDGQTAITVNVDDRGADAAEVALMRRYGEKSILMLPLVYQGRTIGLLEACDRVQSRRYSGQELRLCRALAGQAAVALHNARLFSSVHAAQAETALLRERLQRLTCELAGLNELPASPQTLPALSEAVRAAFEAHSCVIARRGRVLGAAVEAGQAPRRRLATSTPSSTPTWSATPMATWSSRLSHVARPRRGRQSCSGSWRRSPPSSLPGRPTEREHRCGPVFGANGKTVRTTAHDDLLR